MRNILRILGEVGGDEVGRAINAAPVWWFWGPACRRSGVIGDYAASLFPTKPQSLLSVGEGRRPTSLSS